MEDLKEEARKRALLKYVERKTMVNQKVIDISNGWINLLKSKLGVSSEEDEKIFKSRREICNACPSKSALDRCLECGCPLAAKTRSLTSDCPLDLWVV